MASGNVIKALLSIAGKVDPSVEKSISDVQNKFGGLKTAAAAVSAGLIAAGGAAVAFGASSVKAAAEYESQMSMVSTLLDGTTEEVSKRTAQLGSEALKVSSELGLPMDQITGLTYNVISALGDLGDETSKVVSLASKAAKAGGADANDAFNLLSAVTKAYGNTSLEAQTKVSDLAFTTLKLGQTSFPELAKSIQTVAATSEAMGVKETDLFGVFATLTGVTGGAAEVATQYKAALSNLMVPSEKMKQVIDGLGYSSGKAMIEEMGLQKTLETLKIAVGDDTLAFGNLFNSVEAKTAVFALVGAQSKEFARKTGELTKATKLSKAAFKGETSELSATEKAYAKTSDTLETKVAVIKQTFSNWVTEMGTELLPSVKESAGLFADELPSILETAKPAIAQIFDAFKGAIPIITNGIKSIIPHIKNAMVYAVKIGSGIATVVSALWKVKVAFIPLIAAYGVYKTVTAASLAITKLHTSWEQIKAAKLKLTELWTKKTIAAEKARFVASKVAMAATKVWTGIQWAFNVAMSANPIGLIVLAVGALIAGFVLLYKKCEPFRNFINGIGSAIKSGFISAVEWFKTVPTKLGAVWNGIKAGFSTALNWIKENWKGLLLILVNPFAGAFKLIYDNCEGFKNIVNNIFGNIKDGIGNAWNGLKEHFPILQNVQNVAVGIFDGIRNSVFTIFEGVKSVFNNFIGFFQNIFTAQWSSAWQNVKNIFSSIVSSFAGIFKTPLNAMISLINRAIGGINSLNVTIPDWVPGLGGKTLGFTLPQIPMLAQGGFTNGVSIAGEAGTEAVISFNPSYRSENLDTWLKAGQMLGADELTTFNTTNNSSTSSADTYVEMGGVTFSPNIVIQGNADKQDVIEALQSVLPDFYDILNRWKKEQEAYAF